MFLGKRLMYSPFLAQMVVIRRCRLSRPQALAGRDHALTVLSSIACFQR